MTAGWSVERSEGSAARQHERALPDPLGRTVWIHRVTRPALVLGSGQSSAIVDVARARSAGVEVVTRRSGGGAVLLRPRASSWVDLLLPADDPLWDDDVVRASAWVGEAWAAALAALGRPATVHRGRLHTGRWGALVCFAGVGPGEVLVDGRKVVGVSQRRTRHGARFQCLALTAPLRADVVDLLALLDLDEEDRRRAAAELVPNEGEPQGSLDPEALERSLLAHLPD